MTSACPPSRISTAQARGPDAPPATAAGLGASFTRWDELPEEVLLPLRSGAGVNRLVEQIGQFVDARA